MKEFIKPDFTNSNLNISATLAEFLGAPNKNATLPILKKELTKNYKNVVFICFDGLGIYPMKKNLNNEDFLMKNIKQTLLSTFPSTTTNATNSLMLNKLPLEHGWFGWSLYFQELNRNIDIFLNTDSSTGEQVEINNSPLTGHDYYFDYANTDYNINTVFPSYVKVNHPERNFVFSDEREFYENIELICSKEGKQFIYAYYPDPDHTMHDYGVTSKEAQSVIRRISKNMRTLYESTNDSLFVITADHGQIDVAGYVEFYKDEKLMSMLKIYPYLDARTPAFLVKDGMHEQFVRHFNSNYQQDFVLFKSSDLIKEGFFGDFGDKGNLLGDYIAIGTYTHKQACVTPDQNRFKGHHTSLTEEMEVPLIIIKN